jgi:hypothetical protein
MLTHPDVLVSHDCHVACHQAPEGTKFHKDCIIKSFIFLSVSLGSCGVVPQINETFNMK